jgi:hypothetical protein
MHTLRRRLLHKISYRKATSQWDYRKMTYWRYSQQKRRSTNISHDTASQMNERTNWLKFLYIMKPMRLDQAAIPFAIKLYQATVEDHWDVFLSSKEYSLHPADDIQRPSLLQNSSLSCTFWSAQRRHHIHGWLTEKRTTKKHYIAKFMNIWYMLRSKQLKKCTNVQNNYSLNMQKIILEHHYRFTNNSLCFIHQLQVFVTSEHV